MKQSCDSKLGGVPNSTTHRIESPEKSMEGMVLEKKHSAVLGTPLLARS